MPSTTDILSREIAECRKLAGRIGRTVTIRNSSVMGADFYEAPETIATGQSNGEPPLGVGEGSHIEGAILDKNCRVGRNVRIVNQRGIENTEETPYGMIRDGIVVMPKNTMLPDGWSGLP